MRITEDFFKGPRDFFFFLPAFYMIFFFRKIKRLLNPLKVKSVVREPNYKETETQGSKVGSEGVRKVRGKEEGMRAEGGRSAPAVP